MTRAALALFLLACGGHSERVATPLPLPRAPATVHDLKTAWHELCEGDESVPLEIAGHREFVSVALPSTSEALRFHVDTGGNTPGLALRRSVASRLGFKTEKDLPRSIRIGQREIAVPERSEWILVDDDDPFRKDFSVGQIGAGFLSRFVVCIDPARGRIGFGDPKRYVLDANDSGYVPLLMLHGGRNDALYPFVHVLLNEHATCAGGYVFCSIRARPRACSTETKSTTSARAIPTGRRRTARSETPT